MSKKRQLIFITCSFFFAAFLIFVPALTSAALVPCGGSDDYCTICDLYQLAHNILNFLLVDVAIPLATIAFLVGGFLFLTSGGSDQKLAAGKKAMTGALFGLVIAFASWLIVDITLRVVGAQITDTGTGSYLPWNKFPECPDVKTIDVKTPPAATSTPTGPAEGETTTITKERQLAKIVLDHGTCQGAIASCGGVGSCSTLQAVANGNPPPICFNGCSISSTCSTNAAVHLNLKMLRALIHLKAMGYEYTITSLTTGSHSANSDHYKGNAVDIRILRRVISGLGEQSYERIENDIKGLGAINTSVQCEKEGVKVNCGPATPQDNTRIDHIHASFP